jgi:hypothetical protein
VERRIAVLVDDRERAGPVPAELARSAIFEVQVRRLPLGDYLVDGRFLFERKTLPDLAASIASGRLFFPDPAACGGGRRPPGTDPGRHLEESGRLRHALGGDPGRADPPERPRGVAESANHSSGSELFPKSCLLASTTGAGNIFTSSGVKGSAGR